MSAPDPAQRLTDFRATLERFVDRFDTALSDYAAGRDPSEPADDDELVDLAGTAACYLREYLEYLNTPGGESASL